MNMGAVVKRSCYATAINVIVLLFLFTGCASPPSLQPFVSNDLKAGKMAILPFDNLSEAPGAGRTMENYVLVEFLKRSPRRIVEPGEVMEALSQARIRLATNIPKETVISLGEDLGVDLIMIGVVHEYELQLLSGAGGSGDMPVLSVSLRIIDTKTGNIVWAVNVSRTGKDNETVFGMGRIQSINELAANTATELAQAFAASFSK